MAHEDELEFSEALGRMFEDVGSTRIAGRLVGWLLICDPPEQTQAELVELLGVSKASVSTELRRLEQMGVVERTTAPGDRRSFYRVALDAWSELMARRLRTIDQFVQIAERGLELLEHEPAARRERLLAVHHTYGHLQRVMRAALNELRSEAQAAAKTRRSARASEAKRASNKRGQASKPSERAPTSARTSSRTASKAKPSARRK